MTGTAGSRPAHVLAGMAVLVCALSGCSASPTAPVENYAGTPKNTDIELDVGGFGGAWLDDGERFAVTVSGSSTCPRTGSGYSVSGTNEITVTLEEIPADKACTADFAPHTTVFRATDDLDPAQELTVTVEASTFGIPALR
ncbi:MAG: hypothetical protein ABWX65_07210 [Mycetocola sp.]